MATPNLVPRADSEGGIGTASKYWASAYIDLIYVGAGKIGRDADNLIDFSADNHLTLRLNANNKLVFDGARMYPNSNDGYGLGLASNSFSDLFLASGAVINFDNGNLTLTHTSNTLTLADGDVFALGTSRDLQLFHESDNSFISNYIGDLTIINYADNKDIIFQSDDGSGGVETYFFLDGSASGGDPYTTFPDSSNLAFGTGRDSTIQHNGSRFQINSNGGPMYITQSADDEDIILESDNGSGGTTAYLTLDGGAEMTIASKPIKFLDNTGAAFGTTGNGDYGIVHDGSHAKHENYTGDIKFINYTNDADISFSSDNGANGDAIYFYLDGSSATHDGSATTALYTNWPDKSYISLGTSHDLQIFHDGSNSYIDQGSTGSLYIRQKIDDGDIIFQSDDGSGGLATYLTLDGSASQILIAKETVFGDAILGSFGADRDLRIQHSGNDAYMDNYTGNMYFRQNTDDGDIIFQCDDGSGGVETYFFLDGSAHDGTYAKTTFLDNSILCFGTGNDLQLWHNGSDSVIANSVGDLIIQNLANDKDIIFKSDDGSGSETAYLTLDGSAGNIAVAKTLLCADSKGINIGASNDLQISHNGSNSGTITNTVGNLTISNSADDGDIIFQSDDGSGGVETYFYLDGSENLARFSVNTRWNDSDKIQLGTGGDLNIYHTGSTSFMMNYVGDVRFINYQDDGDFKFETDDGAGGTTEYFRIDGGAVRTISSQHISMNDGKALYVGDGLDAGFYHSGGHNFLETNSGNLTIVQNTDDGDIIFQCDDGSGGVATYFFLDGSSATGSNEYTVWPDSSAIAIGTGKDLQLYHNGSSSSIYNNTGDLVITNAADDGDIIFQSDDGSGGTTAYLTLDGGYSTPQIIVPDSVNFNLGTGLDLALQHDGSNSFITNNVGNLTIKNNTDDGDIIFQSDDGSGGVKTYFQLDGSALVTNFPDNSKLTIGSGNDLQIYHDGSNSFIKDTGTGDLYIDAATNFFVRNAADGEVWIKATDTGVSLRYQDSQRLITTATGITVTGATGTTEGGGIDATDAVNITVGTINGEIITTINVDIGVGGILSSSTAGDVIGNDGVASAYITRLTTAINGIVYKGEMICVEVPTTGDPDINLAASSESGIAEDAAGEGQHVLINGGVATLAAKNDITIPSGGIVGDYLYLTHGGTTAGTYDAGQFIIKLYGAATL